jgi:crotonobetainyl-CoA:carnitine CoA-transferase CaiB-like acyl-CoA transferase
VKLEPVKTGETGRQSLPAVTDTSGRQAGATFLRYNLGKRSIAVNLKSDEGRELVLALTPHFDVICENLGPHKAEKLGIGYEVLDAINPKIIVASLSGFGNVGTSPYTDWPAYAAVAESMSGGYEYGRLAHTLPVMNPLGGVGDTGTGLYALVGILAALRHRDLMGKGQYVDVSMLDSMVAICDVPPNYWSLGLIRDPNENRRIPIINNSFEASDGWFMMMIARKHQFVRFAELIGHPEWLDDPRFADPWGWVDNMEEVIRPAFRAWTGTRTKLEVSTILAEAGIPAGPGNTAEDLINDPHIKAHNMLIEVPRTDGVEQPVLVAGNPIKMSRVGEVPDGYFPNVGEHTDEVLREFLQLDDATIGDLRDKGVIE